MGESNLSNFKAVILAGGKGTRLYPITKEIPKPLLPIKRKPIINYLVDLFHDQGIKKIAVLISKDFRGDFEWWKKRYFPKDNIKLVQEKKPLGTFGGLCFLKNWIGKSSFFLTNGDELKKIDLNEMSKFHQEFKSPATIALVKVPDPQHYGVVISKNGRVEEFLEKPSPSQISKRNLGGQANYINSGLYLLSPEIFNHPACRQARHSDPKFSMIEADLFPGLAEEKKLAGFKFKGQWFDCGTWKRYNDALDKWR